MHADLNLFEAMALKHGRLAARRHRHFLAPGVNIDQRASPVTGICRWRMMMPSMFRYSCCRRRLLLFSRFCIVAPFLAHRSARPQWLCEMNALVGIALRFSRERLSLCNGGSRASCRNPPCRHRHGFSVRGSKPPSTAVCYFTRGSPAKSRRHWATCAQTRRRRYSVNF